MKHNNEMQYWIDSYRAIDDDILSSAATNPHLLQMDEYFIHCYQRWNGRRSGLLRRYRVHYRVCFIKDLEKKYNIDMTMTSAKKLSKLLYGKSLNNLTLIEFFASDGRTALNKSKDFQRLETIALENMENAKADADECERKISIIRENSDFMQKLKSMASEVGNPKFSNC